MKTNCLVTRDMAEAALVGALPSEFGIDYNTFGALDELSELAGDMGAEAAAVEATQNPTAAANLARKAVAVLNQTKAITEGRQRVMNPNAGSDVKVARYLFNVLNANAAPVFTVAGALNFNDTPRVTFRPQRFIVNVPTPGLVTLTDISVSNVNVSIGTGIGDAFMFSPVSVGTPLDLPAIESSQRATIIGAWTAYLPPGYVAGAAFPLTMSFIGPAHVAGR